MSYRRPTYGAVAAPRAVEERRMRLYFANRIRRSLAVGMGLIAGWLVCELQAAADLIVVENDRMFQLTEQQLVSSVFRNLRSVADARNSAEHALGVQVEFVALIGTLSDEQRAKLELAGQGDICRFFSEFDAIRRQVSLGPMPQQQFQQTWQEISRQLQPLQARYNAGLHGEGSLFLKTLPSALSLDQLRDVQKLETERNRKRYRALVQATLAAIDGNIPLTARQREQIVTVVVEKTKLPQDLVQNQNQLQFVLFQMSQIEDDLKPLFPDNEWRKMQRILRQGRMFERVLRQQQGVRLRGLQGGILRADEIQIFRER